MKILGSLLLSCSAALAQLVQLPEPPKLSDQGRSLIYEFETGGRAGFDPHPEWPGFQSGVTVGIGYDCGYNSPQVVLHDWSKVEGKERLAATAGISGSRARPLARQVRDIMVHWELATNVFDETTVTKFWLLCQHTFPGFNDMHANAQAGILSLVFNRGNSLTGDRRREMRAIKELIPRQDYRAIAKQIRLMKRVWVGTDIQAGMFRRREAEAALIESAASGE